MSSAVVRTADPTRRPVPLGIAQEQLAGFSGEEASRDVHGDRKSFISFSQGYLVFRYTDVLFLLFRCIGCAETVEHAVEGSDDEAAGRDGG